MVRIAYQRRLGVWRNVHLLEPRNINLNMTTDKSIVEGFQKHLFGVWAELRIDKHCAQGEEEYRLDSALWKTRYFIACFY